jgi:hypothetical protein
VEAIGQREHNIYLRATRDFSVIIEVIVDLKSTLLNCAKFVI